MLPARSSGQISTSLKNKRSSTGVGVLSNTESSSKKQSTLISSRSDSRGKRRRLIESDESDLSEERPDKDVVIPVTPELLPLSLQTPDKVASSDQSNKVPVESSLPDIDGLFESLSQKNHQQIPVRLEVGSSNTLTLFPVSETKFLDSDTGITAENSAVIYREVEIENAHEADEVASSLPELAEPPCVIEYSSAVMRCSSSITPQSSIRNSQLCEAAPSEVHWKQEWAGRPNFKKFKRKRARRDTSFAASVSARSDFAKIKDTNSHRFVNLIEYKLEDYGLGDGMF